MNFFLSAKHWQLFLLLAIAPLALIFILFGIEILSFKKYDYSVVSYHFVDAFALLLLAFSALYFAWLGTIGIKFQRYLKEEQRINTTGFKITLSISFLYVLSIVLLILERNIIESLWFALKIFTYIAGFLNLINIYFAALVLNTVEKQKEQSFMDVLGDFFMFLLFPIGFWVIQPKVNSIIMKRRVLD